MENQENNWNWNWIWIIVGTVLLLLLFWVGYRYILPLLTQKPAKELSKDKSDTLPLTAEQITLAIEKGMASLVSNLDKDTIVVICDCCPKDEVKPEPSKPRARAEKKQVKKTSKASTSTSNSDHQYSDGCNCWICTQIRNPCNNCKDAVDLNCDGDC